MVPRLTRHRNENTTTFAPRLAPHGRGPIADNRSLMTAAPPMPLEREGEAPAEPCRRGSAGASPSPCVAFAAHQSIMTQRLARIIHRVSLETVQRGDYSLRALLGSVHRRSGRTAPLPPR